MILLGLALLVAQEVGGDSSFLLDLFTNIGMAGVFIYLYLDERKERRSCQTLNNQMLERVLPALTEASATLERVQQSQSALHEADQASLEQRLEALVVELRRGKGDA
jgi:hypothetical protein